MKRLAEIGLLRDVDVLSTVSGGSIVGAFLVLRWKQWLNAGADGTAFDAVIVEPFRKIVEEGNFLLQWLQGCWRWPFRKLVDRGFSRTQAAAELLGGMFFGGAECADLPDKPLLILNATSLQSMRAWRFTKWGLGDSRIGHASWGKRSLPLGVCVGASAAFPPVFPPAWIRRDHYSFFHSQDRSITKVPYPRITSSH